LNELLSITCSSSLHMSLPDCSVQCVVTSPPYWGLRKYDGEQDSVWGGDEGCEHEWVESTRKGCSGGVASPKVHVGDQENFQLVPDSTHGTCLKCGAWKGAYGLEPTPEMYVEHTVLFLREIRRALRDDGVVFWNVGDSYWGGKGSNGSSKARRTAAERGFTQSAGTPLCDTRASDGKHEAIKPKDMCLIPFRVALAAQADGWWVRSDIIWAKPNPMPESVKDRPTSSYEHIFMFTKSSRYYWDADAVREPMAPESAARYNYPFAGAARDALIAMGDLHGEQFTNATLPNGRNIRDVWTIATQPSGFKHYAAFPEEIPTRCIKAATKMGDTVLDPFAGTGRTLEAALRLGRKAVGYDLSEKYCAMAQQRCDGVQVEIDGGRY
jgi:DNA modification methylase